MSIEVNGRKVDWVEDENVKDLLKRLRYTFPLVVVKVNDKVIPRSDFSEVIVPDNSKIAVIHMTSGG
ncbi:MAG: sulfur carrier protein ThiS [Thermoplasmatales archaeon]|nr:sulfur carrier protein ThiS [Thermoplasmatales archaeon]MCK5636359.1 sulfur carrier protein ThiS [Thermoplasmatales archaeon]